MVFGYHSPLNGRQREYFSVKRSEYLMTKPSTFGVSYTINPWMQPQAWQNDRHNLIASARKSWQSVYDALQSSGAKVHLLDPVIPLPELVFPTNAAIVLDGKALMSSFSRAERKREQPIFLKHMKWLCEKGFLEDVSTISSRTPQEGSGDCRWDGRRQLFWAGYGQRSKQSSHARIADFFKVPVVSLELIDPRFYQISMALCCLESGDVMYYPAAFSAESRAVLEEHVAAEHRIEVSLADASAFNLNLLALDKMLLMTPPSTPLRAALKERGYSVKLMNVLPFTLAGASVGSLALRLDQRRKRELFVRKPIIQNVEGNDEVSGAASILTTKASRDIVALRTPSIDAKVPAKELSNPRRSGGAISSAFAGLRSRLQR